MSYHTNDKFKFFKNYLIFDLLDRLAFLVNLLMQKLGINRTYLICNQCILRLQECGERQQDKNSRDNE